MNFVYKNHSGAKVISTKIPLLNLCYIAFLLVAFIDFSLPAYSQTKSPPSANILFVLDASGSMKGKWNGTSKFDLAKEILSKTIDSVSRANQKVQFALRVFGHQSPRAANNCKDTKLEVPFTKNNSSSIEQRLNQIVPQGQTPIEFTLLRSLNDFSDSTASNAIILITDGNETCGGNLCDLASKMEAKHIALRPFIVGLGLNDSLKKKFECLGNFYDVQNEDMLSNTMKVVISRVLNPTTCQINLLDAYGNPTETNIEMTLYDHESHQVRYQFIHTLNSRGIPDTLQLEPKFRYDLTVHSIPEVKKENMELVAGTHNVMAVNVPMGSLEVKQEGASSTACIVRTAGNSKILNVQDVGASLRYLVGNYDLEILTLPETFLKNIQIEEGKTNSIKIAKAGSLTVTPPSTGVASVFLLEENKLTKVFDFGSIKQQQTLNLQPGKYLIVYRPDKGKQAELTKQYSVQIFSGKTTSIRL